MPPVPTRIIVSSGGSGITKSGSIGLAKWLISHWYLIFIFISLIPVVIDSIQVAKETQNPYYPLLQTAQSVLNADSELYEQVVKLKENPSEAIGMEKPEVGIYQKTKYFFKTLFLVWNLLGLIFLITFPFVLIYKIVNRSDDSKKWRSLFRTLLIGFLFILISNLVLIVIQQAGGDIVYTFAEDLDVFQKAKLLFTWVFPFHGIISLFVYLISLI